MTYPEALAKIREDAEAEYKAGLKKIDPFNHDAALDLVLELGARVTRAHRHMTMSHKTPDGWEPA